MISRMRPAPHPFLAALSLAQTLLLSLTALAAEPATDSTPKPARSPNLVVILADDLGYGDLGVTGHPQHRTPRLDELAASGAHLDDFYVTSPVCTPTRVALLTARHPVRVGFSTLLWPNSPGGLPRTERTLATVLRDHGYATALVGKWHLGHLDPKFLPTGHGFDTFYGMPYPNDMMPGHPQEAVQGVKWPPMPMMRGEKIVEPSINVHLLTQQYTAEAVSFIAQNHHRPFFLFLSHSMPHTILGASPDFRGRSGNGLYGDSIEELDWSTGEVMRALRAFGLLENTLVVFSSDNGAVVSKKFDNRPDSRQDFFGEQAKGRNEPLKGGKVTTYEGGVRVPGFFSWPGVIPAGRRTSDPAWIADLMPTFLDFAGIPLPKDRDYDGVSIKPLLTGAGKRPGPAEFTFGSSSFTAFRQDNWKLVLPSQPGFFIGRSKETQLFDLSVDIGETNDLAKKHPEIVARLEKRLAELAASASADRVSRRKE
jgi:arylsulfatase A-like enzyme